MADGDIPAERRRDRFKARARRYARVPLSVRTGDLPKRAGSAVVMLALAGAAVWIGSGAWLLFVAAVAVGVLFEWGRLARRFARTPSAKALWLAFGALYIGTAAWTLAWLREQDLSYVLVLAGAVIVTDVGAYFSGRIIGGPKIAPRISPSKTWAGLLGAGFFTALFLSAFVWLTFDQPYAPYFAVAIAFGLAIAVVAQAGDFFESWMKRRAGVKDSGNIIPGHGGLFDRTDGLMAVALFLFPFTLTWQ